MKTWTKRLLQRNVITRSLVPVAQSILGLPFRIRAWVCSRILSLQLIALRLYHRKPLLVFCRFGGIGDIVCTFPALAELVRLNPALHPVYVTLREYSVLPALSGIPLTTLGPRFHCPIPTFPIWAGGKLFEPVTPKESNQPDEAASLTQEYALACGLTNVTEAPRLSIPPNAVSRAKAALRVQPECGERIVIFHTGPTWAVKEWPADRWQSLANLLHSRYRVRILHVGAESHVTVGRKAVKSLDGVESLLGRLALDELAVAVSIADLFVGIDSGMLHMAVALGTPSVAIFGPTNPGYIVPLLGSDAVFQRLPCSFCHHRALPLHWQTGCPNDIACMRTIAPEQVFAHCARQLSNPGFRGIDRCTSEARPVIEP